jgi:hypothetical protein
MMDEKPQPTSGMCRVMMVVFVACLLMVTTCMVTLLIARSFYSDQLCAGTFTANSMPRLTFSQTTEWDETERIHIDEKGVTVMQTVGSNRCYVMPINRENEKRTLMLVHEPLSDDALEAIAGEHAKEFCADVPAYLLKDVNTVEKNRKKRQTPDDVDKNDPRAGGLALEYEQRTPRCEDLVLDCGLDGAVGQTQDCYTWMNGILKMKQECVSPTQFRVYMSKPPGRILKIAQQQWLICLQRRQQGLRC